MFPASESHLLLYYAQLATLALSYSPSFLVANKGVEFVLTLFRLLRQPANGSKNMSGSAQKWVAVGVARVAGVEGRRGDDMWLTLARVAALKCSAARAAPTESTAPMRNILPADNCLQHVEKPRTQC